jgi:ankyrin repeat protein
MTGSPTTAGPADASFQDLIGANLERPPGLPSGCLFVGEGETSLNYGKVVLACAGDDAGKVFYRPDTDDDKPTLYDVADSFAQFLDALKPESKRGPKPWQMAIYTGDLAAVKAELDKASADRLSDAIDLAVEDGQWEILKFLFAKARKKLDLTPADLVVKALNEDRFELAKRMLAEWDVSRTALADCLAGTEGFLWLNLDLVRMLIDKGAEVNTDPDAGESPLHCAVTSTNLEAVQLLIDKGADPTVVNDDGRTPLQLANRLEEPQIARAIKEHEAGWAKKHASDAGPLVRPFDLHGITFVRTGKPITLDEILAFEKEKRLTFPPEYRWLLLQANGAILSANLMPYVPRDEDDDYDPKEDGEQFLRVTLFPLRQADCPDEFPEEEEPPPSLHESAEEASGWYHDGSEIPKGMLPIAELHGWGYDEVGFLLLGCNKKAMGQLSGFDHNRHPFHMTLPDLFARLAEVGRRPRPPVDRLADAVAARDLAGVKAALADDPKMPWGTRDGRLPVRMMFESKYDDALWAYVESGADLHPILSDAVNFDRTDLIKACLKRMKKVKKDELDMLRQIPAVYRDPELLKLLAERGVKFNKTGKFDTPLAHVAAASGSLDALRFALAQGADVHARDKETGRTALIAACDSEHGDPAELVAELLRLGVQPNQWTSDGETALHHAVSHGYAEAGKRLIDAGESMFARHECYAPGMSVEQTRKMMGRAGRQMEKMFAELAQDLDDDDLPPPPDTSTPQGEKAAELVELMGPAQQNMKGMMGQLMEKAQRQQEEGFLGPPANAQRHYRGPEAAARAIPILEAYERARRPGAGRTGG